MSKYSSDKEMKKLFEGFRKLIKEQDLFDGETGKPLSPKAIGIMAKNDEKRFMGEVIFPITDIFDKIGDQYGSEFSSFMRSALGELLDAGGSKRDQTVFNLFAAVSQPTQSAQKPKFKPDIEFPSDSRDKSSQPKPEPKQPETSKGGGSSVPEGVKQALQQINSMIKQAENSGNTEMVNRLKQRKAEIIDDYRNS